MKNSEQQGTEPEFFCGCHVRSIATKAPIKH